MGKKPNKQIFRISLKSTCNGWERICLVPHLLVLRRTFSANAFFCEFEISLLDLEIQLYFELDHLLFVIRFDSILCLLSIYPALNRFSMHIRLFVRAPFFPFFSSASYHIAIFAVALGYLLFVMFLVPIFIYAIGEYSLYLLCTLKIRFPFWKMGKTDAALLLSRFRLDFFFVCVCALCIQCAFSHQFNCDII